MKKIIIIILLLFYCSNLLYANNSWPYRPIRANLHVHTKLSEKARHYGSLSKINTISKPANYYDHFVAESPEATCKRAKTIGLNAVGLSDHDCSLTGTDWQTLSISCNKHNSQNFIALRGYEWTPDGYNHINVFGSKKFVSARAQFVTYGIIGINNEIKTISDLTQFYSWLENQCLENPYIVGQYNHPSDANDEFKNYSSSNKPIDDFMALMELSSGPAVRHTSIKDNFPCYIKAIQKGRWLSPTCGVDNFGPITRIEARKKHTVICLEKNLPLTEENIISALLQRKTYASEDENLILQFSAKCEGDDSIYYLGDKCEITHGSDLDLLLHIEDPDESIGEIKLVEVRKNKHIITNFTKNKYISQSQFEGKKTSNPNPNTICYLIIISQKDNDQIICAPIGVNVLKPILIPQYEYKGNDVLEMMRRADDFKYKLILCDNYSQDKEGNLICNEKSTFYREKDNMHIIARPKNLTKKYKLPCDLKVIIYNNNGDIIDKSISRITVNKTNTLRQMKKNNILPKGIYYIEGYVNNDLYERKSFQIK